LITSSGTVDLRIMKMNAHFFLLLGGVLLASCSEKETGIFPEETSITEAVYASATIEPENVYQANSSVSGLIEERFVKEGDLVYAGQILFRVSDETSVLTRENAELNLEQSLRNYRGDYAILQELNAEINAARLKYENDSLQYVRQKELWNKQVGSKVDLENRKLALDLSRTQWQNAVKRKKRTEQELKIQVQQAQNNLKSSTVRQNDHLIRSRFNGKVYALFKEPGEYVAMQEKLAFIGDSTKFVILLSVDEVDITRIQKGQQVWVRLEAYRGVAFEARISRILPKMDERNQTFLVEAIFSDAPKNLYMGLTGEANIVVNHKDKALVIPREYLQNETVRTSKGIVPVKTGLTSMSHIEILGGISKKDQLFKPQE
jgi:HlyD family secretion protein